MKSIINKQLLIVAGGLVSNLVFAQAPNTVVPFKEIQKNQLTDNFTAREIKKKELEIAPSQVMFLNTNEKVQDKIKNRKKKKINR